MDNAPCHNNIGDSYPELIIKKLPPRSPILNPIEECFSVFKSYLKQPLNNTVDLNPYHTGQLCRQFVQLFCWPTDLEHSPARRLVVIEAFYTLLLLLTLYCLAQHICDAVPKVLILIEEGIIKKISYERRDYE